MFGAGEGTVRTGSEDDVVVPANVPPVKATPVSVSTIAPAAFLTVNVAKPVDRPAPAPGVESKMVATAASSHEYPNLSSETELCGKADGPRDGAASARNTGPATRRPFVFVSSPASRRRLPLRSSLGPAIVICPGTAPPRPLLTVTLQLPRRICESAGFVSSLKSKVR